MKPYHRDTWVEIELDAIAENIKNLQRRLNDETDIFAVVKADAYGHGDLQIAREALRAGATGIDVALLDEALRLRRNGIQAPIHVMGWIRPEDAPLAADHDISVTFFHKEWLETVQSLSLSKPLKLHMKWDTGMGRIGIRTIEEMQALLELLPHENVMLEGIFTHFATADEVEAEGEAYYQAQEQRFNEMLDYFRTQWPEEVHIHTGNSAASMRFPEKMHDSVRFGISMYGLYPSPDVRAQQPIELHPAFSLQSRLVHVKKINPGEALSYGITYRAGGEEWIGTVPVGYGDGWIRKLQGMHVLVDGKPMEIVGRICMDQFMIRLDQEYAVGEKVTLIGSQGDECVSIDDLAEHLDTITYEIPCMINQRVPRKYVKDGKILEVHNPLLEKS
ncbi:alanine racemase [Thalassobacillus sp. CUG 92003]|uniref:alanine racemase n=1 Tax=Thalassobacillus sp. CUG 92003 TaxID=2736641 RepID=UPI0015E74A76